jgi:hypothetical protein
VVFYETIFHPRNASEQNAESLLLLEQNSELFSLVRNGSEGNSESLHIFLFHGTEFRAFSLPRKGSEQNSESFLFRRAEQPEFRWEQTICFVYSIFRIIIFFVGNSRLKSGGPVTAPQVAGETWPMDS